jgi:hypothetical protein
MRVQQNDEYISMLELCTANNEKLRHSLLKNNNRWISQVFPSLGVWQIRLPLFSRTRENLNF